MTVDRDAARERAEKTIAHIVETRQNAAMLGTPNAGQIGALPHAVASDVLALLEELDAQAGKPMSLDLVAENAALSGRLLEVTTERDKLRDRLLSFAAIVCGAADVLAEHMPRHVELPPSLLLVFTDTRVPAPSNALADRVESAVRGALADDEPLPFEPGKTIVDFAPKVEPPTGIASPAPAIEPATPAPRTRHEPSIQIETWNPSNELLDGMPYDRTWVLGKVTEFKSKNAGQSAKRWGVPFKAFVEAELAKMTNGQGAVSPNQIPR